MTISTPTRPFNLEQYTVEQIALQQEFVAFQLECIAEVDSASQADLAERIATARWEWFISATLAEIGASK